jgi:hypothetical protein
MHEVDWDEVRYRTVALYKRRGRGLRSRGRLPETLSETQVREVEEQFGVALPEDYRQYLLHVSAGGGEVRTLLFDGARWDWDGIQHAKLHVPFPDQDSALAVLEDLWESEPKREDYVSSAAYQTDDIAWQQLVEEADAARTAGAIFLREHGCGFSTLLVVSGPMRGSMWFDGRATCDRLNPLLNDDRQAATFAEWYLDWLTHEEPLTTPEERHAAHQRWSAGTGRPIWLRWFDAQSPSLGRR